MKNLPNSLLKNSALFITLGLACIAPAQANTIPLTADGLWHEFSIDDFSSASQGVEWIDTSDSNSASFGFPSIFQFTIAHGFLGSLKIVDASFAGDRFEIFSNGHSLGLTSSTINSSDYSNNFSNNAANANFSKGVFSFTEGAFNVTGNLFSTLQPFNATNGALKLDVTYVPTPTTVSLFIGGLIALVMFRRRAA